jgi:hypothetical protein
MPVKSPSAFSKDGQDFYKASFDFSKHFQLPQRVSFLVPPNNHPLMPFLDREEALRDDYPLEDAYDDDEEDDEWAGDDNAWAADDEEPEEESDAKDESSAYLEFLNEEAQKFQNLDDPDSDDELGEESLLETPLDKIEPYQLFKNALMSMFYPAVL